MSRVVLVGGGTAGHVEPALAVARYLYLKDSTVQLEFIGTKSGVEVELLVDTGIKFHPILKAQFPRKLDIKTLIWPVKFLVAYSQSLKALKGADLLIGFGGYVSAPAYLAAKVLRIPLIIHEANAKPGLANKFGAKLTNNIFIAFEGARSLGGKWSKAANIGIPIKDGIDSFADQDQASLRNSFLESLNLNKQAKTLLIFGGSQGAAQINRAVAGSLADLVNQGWNVIHAVGGSNNLPEAQDGYRPLPYILDMVSAYAAADFIIARSGAVTCAELQAIGKPALLVPLKIGNGEQEANAAELLASGQARIVSNSEFTAEWLAKNIKELLSVEVAVAMRKPRHAAEKIGERALELIRVIS